MNNNDYEFRGQCCVCNCNKLNNDATKLMSLGIATGLFIRDFAVISQGLCDEHFILVSEMILTMGDVASLPEHEYQLAKRRAETAVAQADAKVNVPVVTDKKAN